MATKDTEVQTLGETVTALRMQLAAAAAAAVPPRTPPRGSESHGPYLFGAAVGFETVLWLALADGLYSGLG